MDTVNTHTHTHMCLPHDINITLYMVPIVIYMTVYTCVYTCLLAIMHVHCSFSQLHTLHTSTCTTSYITY